MIFGDGSTSYSSFRLTYPNTSNATTTNKTVEIKMRDLTTEPKRYDISYEFTNNKPTTDVGVEFMFHTDTAYNNNDQCEGYFINGSRIENNCVYTNGNPTVVQGQTGEHIKAGIPDSFSIIDVDDALAFSEKISFSGTGNARPNMVSIGHYSVIDDWGYYTNLNNSLGGTTEREDLGFSLYYTDTSRNGEILQ